MGNDQQTMRDGQGSQLLKRFNGRRFVLGWLVCTLLSGIYTSHAFFEPLSNESVQVKLSSGTWLADFGRTLVNFYLWGILTIGISRFVSRVGLERNRLFVTGLKYLVFGLLLSALHFISMVSFYGVVRLVSNFLFEAPANQHSFFHRLSINHLILVMQSNLILFTLIASVCLAISYYRKYQERELKSSQLESELTQAQLNALKSQLQPHFLFNTLNAISALVRDDPESAECMIVRLSDLLRATLEQVDKQEIRVQEELDFVRTYLEIEKMRFGDRLIVREQIDSETLNAMVPTLIVQTLVENSIRHGVSAVSETCSVTIKTERVDSNLVIQVVDSGPGTENKTISDGKGVGIANSINRLVHFYGDNQSFNAGNRLEGGFEVRIEIPFRVAENLVIGIDE